MLVEKDKSDAGPPGRDGHDGAPGVPGAPGLPGKVQVYCLQNRSEIYLLPISIPS